MKTTRIVMTALALCMASMLQAQTYMLMAVSGDVQVNSSGQWRKAATGAKLAASDQLKLGERSYAAIVFNNTRTFELKKVGVYTLSQISAGSTGQTSSVTSKYVDYVANRSTSNKMGNNMSNLGAVERSMSPTQLSPRNSDIADDKITFVWRKQGGAKQYLFQFSDIDGNEVFKTATADTFVVVDLRKYNLEPNQCYFWRIANAAMKGMTSDELCFKILPAEKRAEINKAASDIKSEMGAEETALSNMVLASYYQDQNVNDKAMDHFERALRIEPSVQEYRKVYAEFLVKMGLAGYANDVLNAVK